MNTTDAGIEAAKTTLFHSMHNFDRACEFMSAYILSKHSEAQHKYANRQAAGGQRQNVSKVGLTETVVVVVEPMGVHAHTLVTLRSPTPTATLQQRRNGKSSVRCKSSYCKCAKVVNVVAAEGMTANRPPTAPHNAPPM
jgi:hypothetical protein